MSRQGHLVLSAIGTDAARMDDDSIEALLKQETNLFALQKGRGRKRLAEDGDALLGQFSGR